MQELTMRETEWDAIKSGHKTCYLVKPRKGETLDALLGTLVVRKSGKLVYGMGALHNVLTERGHVGVVRSVRVVHLPDVRVAPYHVIRDAGHASRHGFVLRWAEQYAQITYDRYLKWEARHRVKDVRLQEQGFRVIYSKGASTRDHWDAWAITLALGQVQS